MKNLIIIIVSLFPFISIAQNLEPDQARFAIPATEETNKLLNGDVDYFQQKSFLRGNHWDTSPRLEKAT
ncbi:MAG: hypothetical protein A2X64_06390 [Ignavibacteria bacterium GWF2_33_9]|nr:MAG: hypothetical protein A2X64_06390 [Ignavibacteria bacterium GWF2_33_9]